MCVCCVVLILVGCWTRLGVVAACCAAPKQRFGGLPTCVNLIIFSKIRKAHFHCDPFLFFYSPTSLFCLLSCFLEYGDGIRLEKKTFDRPFFLSPQRRPQRVITPSSPYPISCLLSYYSLFASLPNEGDAVLCQREGAQLLLRLLENRRRAVFDSCSSCCSAASSLQVPPAHGGPPVLACATNSKAASPSFMHTNICT